MKANQLLQDWNTYFKIVDHNLRVKIQRKLKVRK